MHKPHIRDIPHSVCRCQKHENDLFLLEALKDTGFNFWSKFKNFIKTVVCDDEKEICLNGKCGSCPMLNRAYTNVDLLDEPCTWNEWKNTLYCYLITNEGTIQDC